MMARSLSFLLVIAGLLHCLVESAVSDCRDSFFVLANSSSELAILSSASGGLHIADVGLYDTCHDHETTEYCSTIPDFGYCYPAACNEAEFSSPELLTDLNNGIVTPPIAAQLLVDALQLSCPSQCLAGGCLASCLDPAVLEQVQDNVTTVAEMLLGASEAWSGVAPRQAASLSSISSSLLSALDDSAPAIALATEASALQDTLTEINYSPEGGRWIAISVIAPLTINQMAGLKFLCGDNKQDLVAGSYIVIVVTGLFAFLAIAATWLAEERAKQELDDDSISSSYHVLSHDVMPGIEEEGLVERSDSGSGSEPGSGSGPGGISESTLTSPFLAKTYSAQKGPAKGRAGKGVTGSDASPGSPSLDTKLPNRKDAPAPPSVGERMLLCFDLAASGRALLSTARGAGHFSCFDGIRALSILWVVLGHTLEWLLRVMFINPQKVYPPDGMTGSWTAQPLVNTDLSVDSFFFMAGFLSAYLGLKKLIGGSRAEPSPAPTAAATPTPEPAPTPDPAPVITPPPQSWIPMAAAARWLRLTPLYLFVIMVDTYWVNMMGSGPYWYYHVYVAGFCKRRWWSDILYINNFYPYDNPGGCYGVTWYLANDMQFFLLTPPVLLAYIRRPALGKALVVVATLASIAVGLTLVLSYDMSSLTLKGDKDYHRHFYIKPWTRLPPYSIGLGMGMLWWERGGSNKKFSSRVAVVLAFISCGLLGSTLFGTYRAYHYFDASSEIPGHAWNWGRWTRTEDVLYTAFSRPAWATGVALMSALCFTDQAWLVGRFLNSTLWMTLSRLSYAIYLTHPMIMSLVIYTRKRPNSYTWINFMGDFVSVSVWSVAGATVLFLLVERPVANLLQLLLTRGGGGARKGGKKR